MKRNYKGDPPNPLFEKWLTEMKEQAAANDNPIQYSFGKALSSLKKCPIRLETGKDCLILQHFGKKICDILDKKLEEYKKANNLPSTSRASTIRDILVDEDENVGGKRAKQDVPDDKALDEAGPSNERPVFKVPRNKPYIPKVGSGAYAILTTMYNNMQEPDYQGYMLKKDIISQAQRQCDSPMKSNAIEHYSGWTSMSTLISKHYVIKKGNPAKYSLTDSGVALSLSLIEGRAKHYRESDNEDEDDDIVSRKKKPANKGKKKLKSNSSGSSQSDSAKASTSGTEILINCFSDSDDDDVFKNNYLKNLEPSNVKTKESHSAAQKLDDKLEVALAVSLTETKAKKTLDNLTSENESKTDAAFNDDLKMALALSMTETKMENNRASNDYDEADEDEEFEKALAMSLNESKMKSDIDLDLHDGDHLLEDEKLKTNGIIEQYSDTEMDEDLKVVLALSAEESKLRESYFNDSFDHIHDSEDRSVSDIVNTKRSEADPRSFSKNAREDEIICLDDNDDEIEDRSEKAITNYFEPKIDDRNVDDDESYMEFCKENPEPILPVRKKNNHFIFTDGPASNNDLNVENDADLVHENNDINTDLHITPKKFDGRIDSERSNEKQNLPTEDIGLYNDDCQSVAENIQMNLKNTNPINSLEKRDFSDEIVISDDDENVQCEIQARTEMFTSSPGKKTKTPTKISKPSKENSQLLVNSQKEDEFQNCIDLPSTSKSSNTNPPKPSRKVKEKGNSQTNAKTQETPDDEPYESFILLPNKFDIILLVDTQETSGTKKKPTDDATMSALSDAGVMFEVRSLKVGDFAWIARCRFTQKELILPYIIERKRIDDLGGSITDGRYHEQKHRLKQSGINNVIYLIEHFGKTYHGALPLTSLFQAGINTTVQDGFITKFTKDHKDSMFYLAALTRKLIRMYKSKKLVSCPKKHLDPGSQAFEGTERLMEFSEFNKAALKTKQFTVREMLIKQLVQLKGISAEKAISIAELYPTPQILAEALSNGDKNLLADIEAGSSRRKIGPIISNVLHMFYTRVNLN